MVASDKAEEIGASIQQSLDHESFLPMKIPNYHIAEPVFFNFYRKQGSVDRPINTLFPINCGCWQEAWK